MGSETNIESNYLDPDEIERENRIVEAVEFVGFIELAAALVIGVLIGYLWAGF